MKKLINPFRYLPLRQALCWGIVALILMSVFCWQVGLRMSSITQINYAGGSLMSATLQQLIAWLLFAVVLYAVGAVVSKSKVRFWDVAAFNLFARIPFDLSLLMFAIPSVRSIMGLITDGSFETAMQYMNLLMVVGLVSMLFSIWYFFWSYKAFAEATNIKNGRGVAIFVLTFVVAYLVSPYVLMLV
ncbi:MAG: hypothetical protein IKK27_04570 [Alistipes sp.]|nr:hypothetical protein [Alistipes sp.]